MTYDDARNEGSLEVSETNGATAVAEPVAEVVFEGADNVPPEVVEETRDAISELVEQEVILTPVVATPAPALAARIAAYNAETVQLASKRVELIDTAKAEHETAKKEAKAAKDALDEANDDLCRFLHKREQGLRDVMRGQQELPFGDDAKPAEAAQPEPEAEKPAADESWRQEDISVLERHGLPGGVVGKLIEAEIRTVGDFANWTRPLPQGKGKRITDIPGIGQAKAEKIEDAFTAFWQARNAAALTEADTEDSDESDDAGGE